MFTDIQGALPIKLSPQPIEGTNRLKLKLPMKTMIHVLYKQSARKGGLFFLLLFPAMASLSKPTPVDAPEMIANAFHAARVKSAVYSPDGQWFVTASADYFAKFYSTRQAAEKVAHKLANLPHDNEVNGAYFSPDSFLLTTVSNDNTAKVWGVNQLESSISGLLATLNHNGNVLYASYSPYTSYSPPGRLLLTASTEGAALLWDLSLIESGKVTQLAVMEHSDTVFQAVFNSKADKVLTVSADWTARLWDITQIKDKVPMLLATLKHNDPVYQGAFDPVTDNLAATASADHTAKLWDFSDISSGVARLAATMTHDGAVTGLTWHPGGARLLTYSVDHSAKYWDTSQAEKEHSAQLLATIEHTAPVQDARFDSSGRWAMTASKDHTAGVWDMTAISQGKPLLVNTIQHPDSVNTACFNPVSPLNLSLPPLISGLLKDKVMQVLTASDDYTAKLWQLTTGLLIPSGNKNSAGEL